MQNKQVSTGQCTKQLVLYERINDQLKQKELEAYFDRVLFHNDNTKYSSSSQMMTTATATMGVRGPLRLTHWSRASASVGVFLQDQQPSLVNSLLFIFGSLTYKIGNGT